MQFLAVIGPAGAPPAGADVAALLPAERRRARQLFEQGVIRQIWTRADAPGVCAIFEVADRAAMEAVLATLPLVAAQLSAVQLLVELEPFAGFRDAALP